MSELFTQNYSDEPLFHTDTDISESLHNQVDEASNGEELLDNTEKQAESLLSNDDYVSETKNSISDDRDDVAESLSHPAEGNRKYITGTNTPRASRSNAYYEPLCNQQTNGHRSPAMRGTTAAARGITSASGLVSYQEDFATDAAQDLGVHGAAAELIMQETFLGTAAEDVGILGSYAVKGIKDVQDGTRTAEEVLHTGGGVLRMELGSSAVQIGSAGARTALHYAESFSTSADDFADRAPGIISNAGFQTGHSVIKVARFFAHPVKALVSIGRTALICGAIVLLLLIIGLLGQMSGTTTTSVLCAVSLRQHKNVLNQTLKLAQRDGLIQTNPADLVVMPHAAQFTGTFYTEAQMRDLLTAVKNERLYPIIYVTALYGLRRSEVLGLKWDSINFAMQTLTIRHTVARVTKVVEKNKTKNASSFRSFPLTDDAVRLFKILLQQEQYYRNHYGKDYIDNDYVFTWEDGHPYSPDYVSHTFHKLLKKYDLPHIRFHDLRHTCASMLLSEGYGLKDVQEWLGHSDIKMTANIYGHLDIRRKRSIANGLEQALPRLKP